MSEIISGYRIFFDESRDVTYLISQEGKFIEFNQKMLELFGYNKEELIRINFSDLFVDRRDLIMFQKDIEKNWISKNYETKLRKKNGEVINCLLTASVGFFHEGSILIYQGIIIILQPNNNGVNLTQQNGWLRYRTILQSALDAFLVLDINGKIIEVNKATELISGFSKEELTKMEMKDIQVLETPDDLSAYERRIKERLPDRFERKWRRKNGEVLFMEVTTNFIETKEEKFFFAFARDITQLKQIEETLRKREVELELKTANLEEMNITLRCLMKKREEDKIKQEEKILFNVNQLILPFITKLRSSNQLNAQQIDYLNIIESNIKNITSTFLQDFSVNLLILTPAELQIVNFIKEGKNTKDIANFLNLSLKTIEFYRNNIRKKFGIKNRKMNLRTFLLTKGGEKSF